MAIYDSAKHRQDRADYHRRQRAAKQGPAATAITPAALAAIGLELGGLVPLYSTWSVLQEALGSILADVGSGEAVELQRLQRLRAWAARWNLLQPALQAFYLRPEVHTSEAGSFALRRILSGEGTFSGPLRGALDQLWSKHSSTPWAGTLVPTIHL